MSIVKKVQPTVWHELSKLHDSLSQDKDFDYTLLPHVYENFNRTQRICFLLEIAESAMLKAIEIKRVNGDFSGREQEYSDILAHVKRLVEKYDITASSELTFNKWYQFYIDYAVKHNTWTEQEAKFKEHILIELASRCIAFYIYQKSTSMNVIISAEVRRHEQSK